MKKATLFFASFIIILAWITACRKKSNSVSSPAPAKFIGCRVSQIIEVGTNSSDTTTYNFNYNDDGTVSKISYQFLPDRDAYVKTFTYKTNCIIAYTTDNSESYSKDSLILDEQNRVIYIDHYDYNGSPSPNEVYDIYQYDSTGNLVSIIYHNYNTISSDIYQWKNGDYIWSTAGTDFYTYVYDTGLYNIGNIHSRITDLEMYGRGLFTPAHLRSQAIMDNAYTFYYAYTLDTSGKLTYLKETQPGNYIQTTQITYTCE